MNTWSIELRRGVVELCVLAVLREQEGYGYEIIERLRDRANLELTESTIYPLLARLAKNGVLQTRVTKSPQGPPRQYYRLTAEGKRRLTQMFEHWQLLTKSISQLFPGESR